MIAKLFARIKRNIGRISERLLLSPRSYEFASVLRWLNTQVSNHGTYSLLFDGSNIWIFLKKYNLTIKYLDRFNSISSILLSQGNFEETELDLIIKNLKDNAIFFDIGANVGLYSIILARRYKDLKIYAFEPVPDTIREFEENLKINKVPSENIFLIDAAVTDQDGHVYITTDFHSSNYLIKSDSTIRHMEVKSITIDRFVQENDINKIDLIKIDVEGNEYLVLKGALESIKKFRPIIVMEIIEKDQKFSENKFNDPEKSMKLLLNLDYKYYLVDDNDYLLFMDDKDKGSFNFSYHNYIFYYENINTEGIPCIKTKKRSN